MLNIKTWDNGNHLCIIRIHQDCIGVCSNVIIVIITLVFTGAELKDVVCDKTELLLNS